MLSGIVILDNEVWYRAMRGIQCSSKCSACHSWEVVAILANVGAFSFVELPFSFTIR